MSGREGCLALLLDKSVEHYDLAQNWLFMDLNDDTVRANVFGVQLKKAHALRSENPDRCP